MAPEPNGAACEHGGHALQVGIDDDANGHLEANEIDSTSYVCNGQDGTLGAAGPGGQTGPQGDPGAKGDPGEQGPVFLIASSEVAPGPECAQGGLKVTTGVDTNANGTLDEAEITDTEFVCRPSPVEAVGFKLAARFSAPTGPAAEIVVASPDGKTVVFTNGINNTVDFLDVTDPRAPRQIASVDVKGVVSHAGKGAVTSVAVTPNGRYAIAAVLDANNPAEPDPGALAFIEMANPTAGVVATVALGVGPDSLKITPDGLRAVVAIEDENIAGARMGSLQLVTIDYANPGSSAVTTLSLEPDVGNLLSDLQPEFVDISHDGTRAIVSLQEKNVVAVIDLTRGQVIDYLDAGTTSHLVDALSDGEISLTTPMVARREPDSVCFLEDAPRAAPAGSRSTRSSSVRSTHRWTPRG